MVDKQNIGNAGEYYLASRLSAEGFTTTITLGRAEKYDILAVNPKGKTIKISVKTRYDKEVKEFILSEKDEKKCSDDFYYTFIRLNEFNTEPDFWIIPSKRVNDILKKGHSTWLSERGRKGRKHQDTSMRTLSIVNHYYSPKNWEIELKKYYKNIKQLK